MKVPTMPSGSRATRRTERVLFTRESRRSEPVRIYSSSTCGRAPVEEIEHRRAAGSGQVGALAHARVRVVAGAHRGQPPVVARLTSAHSAPAGRRGLDTFEVKRGPLQAQFKLKIQSTHCSCFFLVLSAHVLSSFGVTTKLHHGEDRRPFFFLGPPLVP